MLTLNNFLLYIINMGKPKVASRKKTSSKRQKVYKMKGCSTKSRKNYLGGSADINLAYPGKNVPTVPNPFLAYTGKGGSSCGGNLTTNSNIPSNPDGINKTLPSTGPIPSIPATPFLNSIGAQKGGYGTCGINVMSGGNCMSCSAPLMGGGRKKRGGCGPLCAVGFMVGGKRHRLGCKCSSCKMKGGKLMKGGNPGIPYPDGLVGEATVTLPEPGNYAITVEKDNLEVCRKPVTAEDPTSPVSAYRYLACVGPDSLVIRHMVAATSNPFSALIHGYRAAVDYFMLGLERPAHDYPLFERQYGDTVAPMIHPIDLQADFPDLNLENANWRVYPDDVIRRLLLFVKERWEKAGYCELKTLGTYTPSPGLVRVCQELGIGTITQQCPGQYWIDGGWELANPGMPDIPYFMSEKDVRRPQAPSFDGVLAAAQCQFVAPTSYRYWLENVLDSSCFQREERAQENGVVPWRAIDLLDAFVNGSRATGGPDVLNVGIEGGETLWAQSISRINRALIQRSITHAQRGGGRVVGSGRPIIQPDSSAAAAAMPANARSERLTIPS